jgi:translocation protein SEC63
MKHCRTSLCLSQTVVIDNTYFCTKIIQDKQEYWWVYISDRKSRTLLTTPYHVTALVEQEEAQLKFTAPRWPGVYTFTVCLRSDSYLGFDQMHDLKVRLFYFFLSFFHSFFP